MFSRPDSTHARVERTDQLARQIDGALDAQHATAPNVIEARSLSKRYSRTEALVDCDLSVGRGEVFGLLGPNGSGKTTLLRLLMGFIRPTAGQALVDGLDCFRRRVEVHRRVAYLPSEARLFRHMRGREVLRFFCDVRHGDLASALRLAERLEVDVGRRVGFLSTGTRQKLALAAVMAADAPILILDEPTSNLDPTVRADVMALVSEAKTAGRTVLFSSHVLAEVEAACDRVAILRRGRLVHLERMDALRAMHVIRARLAGPMLPPDRQLAESAAIVARDGRIDIETRGALAPVLRWLADQPLADVTIDRVGLRSVYERFHPTRGS